MSMDQFERAISRTRKPGPIEQRLPKAVGTMTFAMWLCWAGFGLALLCGLFPVQLGLVETNGRRLALLLRILPLAAVFLGCALYVRLGIVQRFRQAAAMFAQAEKETMLMRWTPAKALVHKYVELFEADEDGNLPDADATPRARATVEKNLRRFDTTTWTKAVTVYLDPGDDTRRVLIDDGRFLYAGRILTKDESPPAVAPRAMAFSLFALLVAALIGLDLWYSAGAAI